MVKMGLERLMGTLKMKLVGCLKGNKKKANYCGYDVIEKSESMRLEIRSRKARKLIEETLKIADSPTRTTTSTASDMAMPKLPGLNGSDWRILRPASVISDGIPTPLQSALAAACALALYPDGTFRNCNCFLLSDKRPRPFASPEHTEITSGLVGNKQFK
ncbi:hypothetical protein Cgig2_015537 [Carnegiea gigantea]|uniref:Uncharacterized protein n=1 Tax=Carnegiea gigantea TaxID=171969 RepID=A0A9Q1GNJ7_9CARY|nr:hypothetical protein Cgig2_015537 [Carnegiea gigantea]